MPLLYFCFAPAIVVAEEAIVAAEIYLNLQNIKATLATINLDEEAFGDLNNHQKRESFGKLPIISQKAIEDYYNVVSDEIKHIQRTMARESSIQLTYQNAIIIYQHMNPPFYELNYNQWSYPSVFWIGGLALQLFSVLLSANSTFSPIVNNLKFQSFIKSHPVGFTDYILKLFQVIMHIVIATGVVYLVWGYTLLFYMTWEAVRLNRFIFIKSQVTLLKDGSISE